MKGIHLAILASFLAGGGLGPALAEELLPHRAVYDLSLHERSERSGITAISGRMVYEFNGSSCDGYTVNFRFVTEFDTEEFSRLIDEQSTTYEGPDGESFDFAMRSYLDGNLDRESRGSAVPEDGGTHVSVERPEQTEHDLGPSLFPTQHLKDLLEKIAEGRTFYETTIFDGSEAGSKVMTTTVVVGRQAALPATDPEHDLLAAAGDTNFWPVNIAYFDLQNGDATGEGMPTYRIAFKLNEAGITHDLIMDYGDFAIAGQLVELEAFDRVEDCN
ncbi:DUF1849 family protein [Chelativorans sp. ZYF759]|uniref:cell envelope integrity EipB family protein n=1 Tax=Chelativorans sp. ZYF759 TaxID=2692213 RepID=UPI00145FD18B|nr:cell envelope integrity EipB family protein [Chelativorans sp. ZYF759]NMG41228.1 DUF1849 family protein [Chelativorans sp. ZYF759]